MMLQYPTIFFNIKQSVHLLMIAMYYNIIIPFDDKYKICLNFCLYLYMEEYGNIYLINSV